MAQNRNVSKMLWRFLKIGLISLVTSGIVHGEKEFRGLVNIIDESLTGVSACSGYCLVPKIHKLIDTDKQICDSALGAVSKGVRENANLHNRLYHYLLVPDGTSPTKFCSISDTILDSCFTSPVKRHCHHSAIQRATVKMAEDIKEYLCALNPPVMECVLHPLMENHRALRECISFFMPFQKYFQFNPGQSRNFSAQMQIFYNNEIRKNNAQSVYNAVKKSTTCFGDVVGETITNRSMSCANVKTLLYNEQESVFNYFMKTDILQCTLNPVLWSQLRMCFMQARNVLPNHLNPDPNSPDLPDGPISPYSPYRTFNPALKAIQAGNFSVFKDFYNELKSCAEPAIKVSCGEGWSYRMLLRNLDIVDSLFHEERKKLEEYCEILQEKTGSASSTKMMVGNLAAAGLVGMFMTL